MSDIAELAGRIHALLPAIDGQVIRAAIEGDHSAQHEWLWYNDKTGVRGLGRWNNAPGQAPYVRLDLISQALLEAENRGREQERALLADAHRALGNLIIVDYDAIKAKADLWLKDAEEVHGRLATAIRTGS